MKNQENKPEKAEKGSEKAKSETSATQDPGNDALGSKNVPDAPTDASKTPADPNPSVNQSASEAEKKAALGKKEPKAKIPPQNNPEYIPSPEDLGKDADGSANISENRILNKVGKKVISVFAEREKSSLPKLTGTDILKMCRDQNIEVAFQFSDPKKLRGRVVLKLDGSNLSLPLDVNQEFNFGVDYDAMAREAKEKGEKFGEEELAAAKKESEMDDAEKNRISIKKLNTIAKSITTMFEDRNKTNLPGITEKEVISFCRNHTRSIGIKVVFDNKDNTKGHIELEEFTNKTRVPEKGSFTFGVDHQAVADEIAKKAQAES